jgi:hypothetical protein
MSGRFTKKFNIITGSLGAFLGVWAGFITRDEQNYPT